MGRLTSTLVAGLRDLKLMDGDDLLEGQLAGDRLSMVLGGGPTIAGPAMSPESALQMIAVNAAVRLKVNAVRSIPLLTYKQTDDGYQDYGAGRKSRYASLFSEMPNPEQPADELWCQVAGHCAYRANAYLWKERFDGGTRDGLVKAIWAIDPRRLVVRRRNGIRTYEVMPSINGKDLPAIDIPAEDLIHIRSGILSPDGLIGMTAITACRQELGAHAATRRYLQEHMGRGANFKGFLYNDNPGDVEIDDKERLRIEEQIIKPGRGAAGSTNIPLFNAKLGWQQIGMSLADQQFLELMGFGVADVARMMDIPPTMLNAPIQQGSLTYRTTREEDQRFLKYGVSPDLTAIEGAINTDPDLYRGSGYGTEFLREKHLAMDTIARYQAHALAIRAGWKTPNDVRRIENMLPLEGGDQLLRPNAQPDQQTRDLLKFLEEFDGSTNGNGNGDLAHAN